MLALWQGKHNKNITTSWVTVTEVQPSPLHMDAHVSITIIHHILYLNTFYFLYSPLPHPPSPLSYSFAGVKIWQTICDAGGTVAF